jgi:dienelactone hydrolase
LFDPGAAYGGWKLDESLGPSTLAIGIDNAGTLRIDEYTHVPDDPGSGQVGGKGDAYSDYVKDVVRPFIEQKFGVPTRVGVMGSSLGGLIAFHEALRDPGSWDFAASLSGTMGWGSIGKSVHNETLIERFAKAQKIGTRLYLDSGGGPDSGCVDSDSDGIDDDNQNAGDNYCENVQLRDVLTSTGYQLDQDVTYWWENGAGHNEAAWAARVFRPIQIFEAL